MAATAQNDGILHITGTTASNAFAVATLNVGASASITAATNTRGAALPLSISLCQTNPTTGQCMSAIGRSPRAIELIGPGSDLITMTINANETPTFGIFATATAQIPFIPQTNRIFVEFKDAGDVVRGATSVAVQTQ